MSVTNSGNSIQSVWIDYNRDGNYQNSEWKQISTTSSAGVPSIVTITVPLTSGTGITGMRIRSRGTGNANAANNDCTNFGTGDFTFECWVYKTTSSGGDQVIIDARAANNATPWLVSITNANLIYFYSGTAYTTSSSISLNTWSHIAVSRSSGTLKIFIDGVSGFSGTVTTNLDKNAGGKIGSDVSGNSVLYGYIDDLRITKGYARYTSNFTAPTTAFPNN